MKTNVKSRDMVLCALFCAIGVVLPQVFHLFGAISGATFLPMHIPVLISGYVIGPFYGAIVGVVSAILSSFVTGMPPLIKLPFMIFELATYGFVTGIVFKKMKNTSMVSIYLTLIIAQIAGRIVNAFCVCVAVYLLGVKSVTMSSALTAITLGIPGIIIQLCIIPFLSKTIGKLLWK